MFVSVIIEPGSLDTGNMMVDILSRYGFEKVQRSCWESMEMKESDLAKLKSDLDRVTDSYDKIRMYQFPVEDCFVVTEMKQKKWRKCRFKADSK